jgi:ketopantoate reductase
MRERILMLGGGAVGGYVGGHLALVHSSSAWA